ncbi:MAG: S1 RNA-binding domain-containing protein [Defluviitaleaceae bacterium]|nr:S1 RNA-binding domain-containing protein [Defluviitaleaceae bacterium]
MSENEVFKPENGGSEPENKEPVRNEPVKKESVDVGGIYEGTVARLKTFGAIVTLPGGAEGLLHISNISNEYVYNVEDFLAVDDVVTVKVLSRDEETGRISLSMKEAVPEPSPEDAAYYRRFNDGRTFDEKFKDWVKASNERQAGLNKRNKRR